MHFSDRDPEDWFTEGMARVAIGIGDRTVGPPFRTGNIRFAFNRFDTERSTACRPDTR